MCSSVNKVQIENCCLSKVYKHKAAGRLLLPEADLKISLLQLSNFLVAFKILLSAVRLVRMRLVLTLEHLGTGVEAFELVVALVSGPPALFL